MIGIDCDVHKDVKRGDLGSGHRNEATVGIMDQEIAAQCTRSIIIYTAGAVRHIAHDQGLGSRTELSQDIGYGGGKHEQTFRHLQRDSFGLQTANAVDCFVYLEGIIWRQQGNGGINVRILENLCRDLVQNTRTSLCCR